MAHKIYYNKNAILNVKTYKFNNEQAPQSHPYPYLTIQHSILTSSISQYVTDYEQSLYGYQVSSLSEYEIELSSSIFEESNEFRFKITADIADEHYFDLFYVDKLEVSALAAVTIDRTINQVQNFYKENIKEFFPDSEVELFESNRKYGVLIEAIANQLDNLDQMAENIVTLTRIDEIPEDYMRYLAQVVGYETADFTIATIALRSIIREIFNIYNLRGTQKGFEQFFRSLGYQATIDEKWFDGLVDLESEKPHAQKIDSSALWQWDKLTGSEMYYPTGPTSTLHGKLDLIVDENNDFQFVELYPSSVRDYSFDARYQYRENNKFTKSEYAITELAEPVTPIELVPDIITQMIEYISFLKPIHIKIILRLLKEFDDIWWKVDNSLPVSDSNGNVPRDIDEVQFGIGYESNIPIEDSAIFGLTQVNEQTLIKNEQIYFDGQFTLGETSDHDWVYSSNIKGDYVMLSDVEIKVKYTAVGTGETIITALDLNRKIQTFGDPPYVT